ncbi:hypothetical protein BD309DRAFT_996019 [Dichomitus squalens]|uniref:Uncharacterized protein n=1 Tax=Dichomitus squalens TaxID=114155 RepID=A0A4Q9Q271_9APHY|nr:uncharacterized protein DICSQDRAFT_154241 [Dichomitus squalens LYAD-421 SS1]EJF63042.1 hypothetical protein DICSQDRAFT_154241 [Dichomitus squalens LYAD-421 SS1]TBU50486.1 hypothetical protein BD309DRAFT_996019 [Dichomitus squalens]TBU61327.1 hypothetical protein BD310DRAFT_957107 [Dichomitus squalens]
MTTATDNAWMPSGRRQVTLGNTLKRTLKLRQGIPVKNAKVEREFYSFRYNFKPESVDTSRSGTVETKKSKDETGPSNVTVVRPSQQNESGVHFVGQEKSAKEFECVLIHNEEDGSFILEKIDSYVALHHDPKPTLAPRHVESPAPSVPPRISASSPSSSSHAQLAAVKQEEEESEGEIPETKPEPKTDLKTKQSAPKVPKPRQQQSTSTSASAPAPTPTPAAVPGLIPPPMSATSRSGHSLPLKSTPAGPVKLKNEAPDAPPSQAPSKLVKSPNKRERPVQLEAETLEIRRPQPPAKKPRVVQKEQSPPPPPKPVEFAFPDSSSAVSLPPAPVSAAPNPIAAAVPSDSEDDEWDIVPAVAAPASPAPTAPSRPIVMEEIDEYTPPPHNIELPPPPTMPMSTDEPDADGEEIDMALFEEELNDQLLGGGGEAEQEGMGLDEDEDFLAGAVSPIADRQPISLSEFAGGSVDFGDDDEYSSSDDSDDD